MFFKEWLELLEVFGAGTYTVPKDKEQQLFDFYMLSFLQGLPQNNRGEEKVDYALKEVTQILLPTLKENLLVAVFYSLCAEFRHIFDRNDPDKLLIMAKEINEEYAKGFRNYAKILALHNSHFSASIMRPTKVDHPDLRSGTKDRETKDRERETRERETSYHAVLKSGLSKQKFVYLMKIFYEKATWGSYFGGPAWAKICEAWMALNQAKNNGDMIVYIDHIYDLQHNTGTVFNKIQSYAKSGDYRWFKNALDLKASIKDPHEIIDKVSPKMRKLALQTIKAKTGKSYEEYLNKWSAFPKPTSKQNSPEVTVDLKNQLVEQYTRLDGDHSLKLARILLWSDQYHYTLLGHAPSPEEKLKNVYHILGLPVVPGIIELYDRETKEMLEIEGLSSKSSFPQSAIQINEFEISYLKTIVDYYDYVKVVIDNDTKDKIRAILFSGNLNIIPAIKEFIAATNYSITASKNYVLIMFTRLLLVSKIAKPTVAKNIELHLSIFDGPLELKWARVLLSSYESEINNYGVKTIVSKMGFDISDELIYKISDYYSKEVSLRNKYHMLQVPTVSKLTKPQQFQSWMKALGPAEVILSEKTKNAVINAIDINNGIPAIKLIKDATGWNLQAAKNLYMHLSIEYLANEKAA